MFIFIFRPKKNRRRSGRDKKIALDAEAWREKERAGVATTHDIHSELLELASHVAKRKPLPGCDPGHPGPEEAVEVII